MANEEHLAILNQGVQAWNAWRASNPSKPDLSRANLEGVTLQDVNLREANLRGARLDSASLVVANLLGADLSDSSLVGANLGGALLRHTVLRRADFTKADLTVATLQGSLSTDAVLRQSTLKYTDFRYGEFSGSDFTSAKIDRAVFRRTGLKGANFCETSLYDTVFSAVDLSEVKGLDSVIDRGGLDLDLDTLFLSGGNIPHSFLRCAGVTQSLIDYLPLLLQSRSEFNSCFISYSSKDEQFARRLYERLRVSGLRIYFAPEDMKSGQKLHEQIESAIRVYDKLLIVLSEASLQSEWVMTELRKARKVERQTSKRKLFPVRLVEYETLRDWECFDADSGKDLAVELREYFIPDFSNWKDHDAFETAFTRLLNDLRSEERAK